MRACVRARAHMNFHWKPHDFRFWWWLYFQLLFQLCQDLHTLDVTWRDVTPWLCVTVMIISPWLGWRDVTWLDVTWRDSVTRRHGDDYISRKKIYLRVLDDLTTSVCACVCTHEFALKTPWFSILVIIIFPERTLVQGFRWSSPVRTHTHTCAHMIFHWK